MKSLDPRVERLPAEGTEGVFNPPAAMDQLGTFEVFVKPKEGKPFQHEGAVHAPDLALAYILAKETFTRRFTCVSLCVAETENIAVSAFTESDHRIWDLITDSNAVTTTEEHFEVFFLPRRGKQHLHAGTFSANSPQHAMMISKEKLSTEKHVFNLWAVATRNVLFTSASDDDLWLTLPEKKFRDASEYKGGDRLKNFLEANHYSTAPNS